MMTTVLRFWWPPFIGTCLVAWSLLTHREEDSHLRMTAMTLGGAMVARAERAFFQSRQALSTGKTAEQRGQG